MIHVPVSAGELVDKLTILAIKSRKITDAEKLQNIRRELDALQIARAEAGIDSDAVRRAAAELERVNEALWTIEDDIRDAERRGDFGAHFIELARSVYRRNDERADLKRQINQLTGSELSEEKSYAAY